MALINCHECSKGISDKAPNCPHCGAPNIYVVEGSEGPSSNSMKMLMKKLLKGVIALTVLAVILITVQISVDRNPFESLTTVVLVYTVLVGILLLFFGAAGWFVVWVVSRVARDKGAGNVGVASVSIATEGVIILVVLVVGSLLVLAWLTGSVGVDGDMGWTDGEKCGVWLEDGGTVTHPPCPPGLEDGN